MCKAGIESRVEHVEGVLGLAPHFEPSRNLPGHFTDFRKRRAREMRLAQEEDIMRSVLFLMAAACCVQWPLAAATAGAQASCSGWNTKAFFVPAGVAGVSRCLKAGAEVNARDKFGRTPLHWAATYSNSQAVVTALLKAGAEVNARGRKKGLMPIHAAAYSRLPQIVTVLAQAGADVNAGMEDGTTALHVAAWFSQTPAVVTALLDAGAKVNARSNFGGTPLHVAAEHSRTPGIVAALLDGGADPAARDKAGQTPLDLVPKHSPVPPIYLIRGASRTPTGPPALVMAPSSL